MGGIKAVCGMKGVTGVVKRFDEMCRGLEF
jgi:hypothetical protein